MAAERAGGAARDAEAAAGDGASEGSDVPRSETEDRRERKRRKSKRERGRVISFLTALFPLLTAVIGFLAAVFGLWQPTEDERRELSQEVEELTVEVTVLQEVNVSLEAALADAVTDVPDDQTDEADRTPPEPFERDTVGIFSETAGEPVTIPRGFSIDLDSREDNWGISRSTGRGLGLSQTDDGLRFFIPSRTIALMDGEASYDDCNTTTRLRESLTADHMVPGQGFCARTLEGRWAFVTIVDVDHDQEEATVELVVWNLDAG